MKRRTIVGALVAMLLSLPAGAQPRKTILILLDENRDLPGLAMISESLRATFQAQLHGEVEFLTESLTLSQFQDPGYRGVLRDHFRRKYADKRIDLIVAVMQPSLEFLLDDPTLFAGVPIVFCSIDASYLQTHTLPVNVTGVTVQREYAPTVDLALRLQPGLRDLYVIGGTSAFDRQLVALAQADLAVYERKLHIRYLTDRTVPEILETVRNLPARSAILYLSFFRDAAGHSFVPHDLLDKITAVANAPTFVAIDQYVDHGAVGGHVYSVDTHGRQAAEMGVRVLRGEKPAVVEQPAYRDVFDWRQLERWGFDEDLLPQGSEIRNRPHSVWALYKKPILAGLAILLLQSALILALVIGRAQLQRAHRATRDAEERRRVAEEEAQRQRNELAHALRLTTLGELTASFAHEIGQPLAAILMNTEAVHRLLKAKRITPEEVDEALGDIEDDARRAAETIQRLRALYRKEQVERTSLDLNEIIKDVVSLMRTELKGKDIHVEFHPAEGLPNVVGDPVQLRQVILNLLVNAGDALARVPEDEREIHIATEAHDDDESVVKLVVTDTGTGAKDADLEKIFDRFVSTKPHGLGLGLAISRSIVEAHRGRIWATRNSGRGLSMHVEIPTSA